MSLSCHAVMTGNRTVCGAPRETEADIIEAVRKRDPFVQCSDCELIGRFGFALWLELSNPLQKNPMTWDELKEWGRREDELAGWATVAQDKTGLSKECCLELLRKGWRYVEDIAKPARWVSPVAAMQKIGA